MNYRTQNGRTSKRGAFINGIWHCDCEPRMPADKFQTKNGGKNHGRWFYTCQKPQLKRCTFFLWQDDAEIREESAVLSNSRSEPGQIPQTPRKPISTAQAPLTPQSAPRPQNGGKAVDLADAPVGRSETSALANEDPFEWPSSDEAKLADTVAKATRAPPDETPSKTPWTGGFMSPGKRSYNEMQGGATSHWSALTPNNGDDVFATPTVSKHSNGLVSPTITPAQLRSEPKNANVAIANETANSALATEALKILAPIPLNSTVEAQLVALLNRHDLRTQGIAKGRDITRLAIQAKEKKIAELQTRIAGLEAERETSKTVVAHLKQDIGMNVSSPKKRRGRFASRNGSPSKT